MSYIRCTPRFSQHCMPTQQVLLHTDSNVADIVLGLPASPWVKPPKVAKILSFLVENEHYDYFTSAWTIIPKIVNCVMAQHNQ